MWMHVCMYVKYVRIYKCIYVYVYVCMCVYVCVCLCACVRVCACVLNVCMHNYVFICMYVTTVQLKGNLTHADTTYTNYWPKAHSLIYLYWHVQ